MSLGATWLVGRLAGLQGGDLLVEAKLVDLLEGADEVLGLTCREECRLGTAPDAVDGRAAGVADGEGHPPTEQHHRPESAPLEVDLSSMGAGVGHREVADEAS